MPKKPKELAPSFHSDRSPKADSRRFSRSITAAARAMVPPELLVEYCLAVWQGHGGAVIRQDERFACGWTVVWSEHGPTSTPEQIQWAWTQLRQAGWGTAEQYHVVEAHHTQSLAGQPIASLGRHSPAMIIAASKHMAELANAMRQAQLTEVAGAPAEPTAETANKIANEIDDAPAIDAEFVDKPDDDD